MNNTKPAKKSRANSRSTSLQTKRGRSFVRESQSDSGNKKFGNRNRFGGNKRRSGGKQGSPLRQGSKRGGRKMPTFDPSMFINTNPVEVKEEVYTPKHASFADFAIDANLAKTLDKMGITSPSPIQDQTIPHSLEGRDVIGLAETGTGKTASFLVPIIQQAIHNPNIKALILAPTRELALQIQDEQRKITRNMHLYSALCVGGMNIQPQIRMLKRKNQFIIGTPGRVLDLIGRGDIKPQEFSVVVLDEADRMLDMGFIHDMKKILADTPRDKQTLFFSATMTPEAKKITEEFLRNPEVVSVKKKEVVDSIAQDVVTYGHSSKFETLKNLFDDPDMSRVIIFGAMKHSVEKLSRELTSHGIKATSIHGNKTHGQRQRALKAFKDGQARVLVATDVAARGIHVDDVSHVINYDLPQTFEDYVHRIGRTGRADKRGKALTFVEK